MKSTYAFIGGGNMGRALIGGLIKSGHAPDRIRVADADAQSRALCASQFGVAVSADNRAAADAATVVVLAVKPQQLRGVALALAPNGNSDTLFVSIAAGITLEHLGAWLGKERAIVRCMPNTPALVGSGAAALYANTTVNAAQRELATHLLSAVGRAWWVEDEGLMDAVTAVSGSGPAYFFLFIELIEKIAQELGLEASLARALALETAWGAATLARASDAAPATLREQVTSAGGTTARALATFAEGDLEGLVRRALGAAHLRSIELAREVEV